MNTLTVDVHTHILPPDFRRHRQRVLQRDATFRTLFSGPGSEIATAEELLEAMEANDVDVAVLLGYGWCDPAVAREANDYLLDAAQRFPGRFVPFCAVNPAWGDAALAEVERCAAAGARGIGELHPDSQGFDLGRRDTMAPLMEVAQDRHLVVLTHSSEPVGHPYPGKGQTTPGVLMRFIESFPQVPIVCAHWGGGLPFYALMPEVRDVLSNVYFDTAASPFLYQPSVYTAVSNLVGLDKILFGSDYPLLSLQRPLSEIRRSIPDAQEWAAAVGGNAARLLGLPAT